VKAASGSIAPSQAVWASSAAPTPQDPAADTTEGASVVRSTLICRTSALREMEDAHITVIPSPGHKADPKGWVHRTAPVRRDASASLQAAS